MAARLGPVWISEQEAGATELEVELPPHGLAPALMEALRAAARGELSLRSRRQRSTGGDA